MLRCDLPQWHPMRSELYKDVAGYFTEFVVMSWLTVGDRVGGTFMRQPENCLVMGGPDDSPKALRMCVCTCCLKYGQ